MTYIVNKVFSLYSEKNTSYIGKQTKGNLNTLKQTTYFKYSIYHIKPASFSSKNNLVAFKLHCGSHSLKMQMSNS